MQDFEGKTAVITGGASGIGRALADRFAAARMNIVLADIEADALDKAVTALAERQTRVIGVVTNTMLRESIQELAQLATAEFGNVHVLCNNAGVASTSSGGKPVWETPQSDWDWVMGVNFYGVLHGVQIFVPHMLAHGEPSHIVNTASLAAMLPGGGSYGVSKHGVLALTEGLQTDLASRGANINASVLCPGFVNTQIFAAERNRPDALAATGPMQVEAQAMLAAIAENMLAQGKDPAEIADTVFNAINNEAFYILPHPAWDDIVKGRVEQILARGGVATTDMTELLRRRDAGEQF